MKALLGSVSKMRMGASVTKRLFLLAVLICCSTALLCLAQSAGTGAIVGVVSDPSGALVPNAKITVTNIETGEARTAQSQANGEFSLQLLPPGSYRVLVTAEGFSEYQAPKVTVDVTETSRLNVQLELGHATQTVTVESGAEQLQTESSTLGRTVSGQTLRALPLATRNFTQILGLSPGVSSDVQDAGALGNGFGGTIGGGTVGNGSTIANGGRSNDNNFEMDGLDVNDRAGNATSSGGVPIPNPDTIQEFKVQTGLYDATFGRNAGANVNLVTKGGGNKFHGNLWEYLRNTALDANYWLSDYDGQPKAVFQQNVFGYDLGGPVPRTKLTFFTSYQGIRQKNAIASGCASTAILPPLTNDRSQAAIGALFAGLTGQAGAGARDTIQANGSNIAPQALALLNVKLSNGQYVIPTPQTVTSKSKPTAAQFDEEGSSTYNLPCPYRENQFMINGDYDQSQKSTFAVRFFRANSFQNKTLPNGSGTNSGVPGWGTVVFGHNRVLSISHTYVINPRLVNEVWLGYHSAVGTQLALGPTTYSFSNIGATVPTFDDTSSAIMQLSANLALGGTGTYRIYGQTTYEGNDLLSYVHGKHTFQFGGGLSRVLLDENPYISGATVVFPTFTDFLLGLPPGASGNGTAKSNISSSKDTPGLQSRFYRTWSPNAFVQDNYKPMANLTLNLGFRFDDNGFLSDKEGRNTGFDPALITPFSVPPAAGSYAGFLIAGNYNGPPVPQGVTRLPNNWGFYAHNPGTYNPRFGFSWQPPHVSRLVVRGGYGVYHSILEGSTVSQTSNGQPFTLSRKFSQSVASQAALLSWATPLPAFTEVLPSYTPATPTSVLSISSIGSGFHVPTIQEFSLNTQVALNGNLMFEVGYVGSLGQHAVGTRSVNQAALASATNPINGITTNTVANVQQRVPYQGYSADGLQLVSTDGAYNYNSLQVSLTKRMSHGLQFLASYTYAKELSNYQNSTATTGAAAIGDQNNALARYGPEAFIRPQRFIFNYIYDIPSLKGNGFIHETLGGWQTAGIVTYQTGEYLTLTISDPNNVYGITGSNPDTPSLAPNCTKSQLVVPGRVQDRVDGYFNTACIIRPAVIGSDGLATGFGNLGTGDVRGPGQANWDASLGKHFLLPERFMGANLEFRADFLNALNHPQFLNPGVSIPITSLGVAGTADPITAMAVNPRMIQFALRVNF